MLCLDYLGTDHKKSLLLSLLLQYRIVSCDIQCVDHPNFGLGTLPHFILLYYLSPTALLDNLPAFISL